MLFVAHREEILLQSRATGRGTLVEAPLVEGALTMSAEQVIRWTARGELLECQGNRSENAWVQGVFLALDQQPHGYGLDSACRQSRRDLLP